MSNNGSNSGNIWNSYVEEKMLPYHTNNDINTKQNLVQKEIHQKQNLEYMFMALDTMHNLYDRGSMSDETRSALFEFLK